MKTRPSIRPGRQVAGAALSYSATEAKNEFGKVLEKAMAGNRVVITKHDAPKAVLMSIEQYRAMSQGAEAALAALSREFDEMLARMQQPDMRRALDSVLRASPKEMGQAAVKAARKRA